ncbi:MAG: hypothetical protein O3A51_13800, partial [Verrucomicrobia bacterium]|nr:hypothetical protein [Verrucomicrobiota bacterium]
FSDGRVTQMAVTRLPDAPASVLTHRVLVDMQIDGEGAPVIKDNRLAGIIIAYQASTRIATMISLPPLERFLADAAEPPYRGPATAGISWRSLTDPAKRAYLGVSDQPGGIQLIATIPGSGADKVLQPLDVVVRWDGYALDNLGFYNDPELGRLEFSHMVKSHRSPGDTVTADIVRDGKPMSVAITLTGDLDPLALVPENITGEKPAYLVVGGFVIREMDAHYLRAHGSEWRASVDPRLLNFYLSGGQDDYAPGDRIVLLAAVIPDAINVDYHGYRNEVITHVNGEPIRNMNDVLRIANSSGPITRIRLMGMGIDLVLDAYDLYVANQRMAQRYRIPELRYERPVKEIP